MQPFSLTRAPDPAAAVTAGSAATTAQQGAEVRFLAGGTTLLDLMKLGVERPERLVDVTHLGLNEVERRPDGGLRIGATVRNSDLARHPLVKDQYPALSQAILAGASAQLRNMATTAGNLLQRTRCVYFRDLAMACNKRVPGSGCAAMSGINRMHAILGVSGSCIATHPSDMAVAMLAYDAVVHIIGANGDREVPLAQFYLLPRDRPDLETALGPGDLITYVDLPPAPAAERASYLKLRDRASYEFALVSCAAAIQIRDGLVAGARLALGGVGTRPWRTEAPERALIGRAPGAEAFREAADLALQGALPQTHNRFKLELARRCVAHALSLAAAQDGATGHA